MFSTLHFFKFVRRVSAVCSRVRVCVGVSVGVCVLMFVGFCPSFLFFHRFFFASFLFLVTTSSRHIFDLMAELAVLGSARILPDDVV